ncbi:acetate--CoA ligase family protein, partial [Thermodesulfobacteriota bacterium]
MKTFFEPRSVAVVGVSESPTNLGRRIMNNMIQFDYSGIVYAVGPKGGVIHGRRIYHSVLDIPDQVDLAVILTPARTIPQIIDDCGRKGISHTIIESAGFREYGDDGVALENEILDIAGRWPIRLLGPNGIGTMNMENGLATPFAILSSGLAAGGISIISQSGGVGLSYMNLLASESLGLNKFASVGNKLDVDENDILEYLIEDEGTKIICMYLEGISDGRRLMEIAARSDKPILLHKSNIGEMGNRIAHSHTAALSSDDKVVDAALRQCGIIRFHDMHKLGNFLKILALPPMRGKNLAILSRSGGHAVIAADACEMAGFDLPQFPGEFLAAIEKHFRANVIKLMNPLDLGDLFDPDVYTRIMEETIKRDEIDGIVFLHTYNPQNEMDKSRKLLPVIEQLSDRYTKPIAVCISSEEGEISLLRKDYAY